MKQVSLNAKIREERGTTRTRALRAQGWVPAELYGRKEENKSLSVPKKELTRALQGSGGESLFFNLAIGGDAPVLAVLREVQYDRLDHSVQHADFQKVRLDEKVRVKVPVRVLNQEACEGVKAGGTLQLFKRSIEVFCLPDQIPQSVEVDVTSMQIAQSLHVSDLKLPQGIQVLDSSKTVVLSIAAPMAEEAAPAPAEGAVPAEGEAAATPAEGAASGEPEVITAKKKEGEEGAPEAAKGKEAAKDKAPAKK
jgi:large subunit ribosomal protein L25